MLEVGVNGLGSACKELVKGEISMKKNKYFLVSVDLISSYSKVIKAKTLEEAEELAEMLDLQDDEENYTEVETMPLTVEECNEEGETI